MDPLVSRAVDLLRDHLELVLRQHEQPSRPRVKKKLSVSAPAARTRSAASHFRKPASPASYCDLRHVSRRSSAACPTAESAAGRLVLLARQPNRPPAA